MIQINRSTEICDVICIQCSHSHWVLTTAEHFNSSTESLYKTWNITSSGEKDHYIKLLLKSLVFPRLLCSVESGNEQNLNDEKCSDQERVATLNRKFSVRVKGKMIVKQIF